MTLLSILAIIIALATTMPMAGQTLDEDFDRLDKTLGMAADYVAAHESKTSAIRELLDSRNASPAEAYDLYGSLYRAEYTFRFNSDFREFSQNSEDRASTAWK